MSSTRPESAPLPVRATKVDRKMSDGRDIIYFDVVPDRARDAVDRRTLDDAPTHTELRHDPLADQWVVVAGHRQARTFLPPNNECPLCPTTDEQLTEVAEPDYDVVVFENRFPSLTQSIDDEVTADDARTRPGFGRCEVVCFTSDHSSSLAQVDADRIGLVLDAWIDRTAALSQIPGIEYVFVFENRGVEIGVTLSHPHGQIYGYPFVPPREQQIRASARAFRERTGDDLFEQVIADELADGERVLYDGDTWIAFVPRSARWPFEIQMYTKRTVRRLTDLSDAERVEFSSMYLAILRSLDSVLGVQMPYIAAWHQAPVHADDPDSRLFLEVFSLRRAEQKLKYLAGSESAAGVWINDIRPEDSAARLREAMLK